MKTSIREELTEYINDNKNDYTNELHYHLFNEDYYLIGYCKAEEWLQEHNLSTFEALDTIREYEEFHFGETQSYTDAEKTVNMLVYIYGEELLAEMDLI
tara:strand:- start:13599 stop:13895 length:297 start_codon:yes stop_codon:yes gene_type:complete